MKILLIGCGYIGSVLARHLSRKVPSAEIVVSDKNREAAKKFVSYINRNNVSFLQLDFCNYDQAVKTVRNFDILVGLTPGRLGWETVKAAIEARVSMVDLSYMPQDPLALNEEASRAGISVIPDCGVAPGLSNILVGRAVSMLDRVESVRILVGGLPQEDVPPLGYRVTWCVEDLVEEYVRKAKIVRDGTTIDVEALEGLEEVEFPGIGRLEAFYTDGVRTLHHTIKATENMWEKTLRYPGHAKKIRVLRDLGFFGEKPVGGVPPRSVAIRLLEQKLSMPEIRDLLAMKIEVGGIKKGEKICYSYVLLDYYDEIEDVTAMGRTTAYTAAAVIQLLAKNEIKERGIIPPERLGMNSEVFEKIMAELRGNRIEVREVLESFAG